MFPAGPGPIALAERLMYRFTVEGEDLEDFIEMDDAGFISRDHIAEYAVRFSGILLVAVLFILLVRLPVCIDFSIYLFVRIS